MAQASGDRLSPLQAVHRAGRVEDALASSSRRQVAESCRWCMRCCRWSKPCWRTRRWQQARCSAGSCSCPRDHAAGCYGLPDPFGLFVASRPDLEAADREMLLGWRDPVEGIFELRGQDGDAIILLNLEEHTRCSAGDAHKPQPAVLLAVPCDRILLMPPRPTPRPIRLTQLQNAKLRGIESRGASAPCLRLRVVELIRYHSQGRHS